MRTFLVNLKELKVYGAFSSHSTGIRVTHCPVPEEKRKEMGSDYRDIVVRISHPSQLNLSWESAEKLEWEGFTGKKHYHDLRKISEETNHRFAFISANGIFSCDTLEVCFVKKDRAGREIWDIEMGTVEEVVDETPQPCFLFWGDSYIEGVLQGRKVVVPEEKLDKQILEMLKNNPEFSLKIKSLWMFKTAVNFSQPGFQYNPEWEEIPKSIVLLTKKGERVFGYANISVSDSQVVIR